MLSLHLPLGYTHSWKAYQECRIPNYPTGVCPHTSRANEENCKFILHSSPKTWKRWIRISYKEMCSKEHTAISSICKSSRIQYYKVLHQYDGKIPIAYLWIHQNYQIQVTKRKQKQKERKGQTYVPMLLAFYLTTLFLCCQVNLFKNTTAPFQRICCLYVSLGSLDDFDSSISGSINCPGAWPSCLFMLSIDETQTANNPGWMQKCTLALLSMNNKQLESHNNL